VEKRKTKRKLTAILSADVKGYSRLMGEDEKATVETLKTYREVMGNLIRQYKGRVIDSPGDNVLSEFASVVDAVECAVKIQEEVKKKNEELPENRRMEFRIGVHHGDVIEDEKRIYGDGVNIAARIEGLAEGGGICISRTSFDSVKNKLNLGYEYLGEHSVKNIAEPVRVYKVLMEPEYAGKVIGEERPKPRQWRWAAIGALVVLIIVAGMLAVWNFYLRPPFEPASVEKMAFPLPEKPSIAVLPFTNMSGDPDQDYFSDGLTDQIISSLSKVPHLFVVARNSTFTYKGKPVKINKVAEDLGVQYVLEGSVQKSGDRVRITAQLIDAITGHHIWSERYDRDLKDIFALQDEITIEILKATRVEVTVGDQYRYWIKWGTKNLKAYEKNLQGLDCMWRATKEDNAYARQLFEEAIALDPNYVMPYVHLGWTHFWDARVGWSESPRKSFKKAFKLAQKTLAMDDSIDLAHSLLGAIYLVSRKYEKGLAEGERAVALNPNGAFGYNILGGIVSCLGRWEDGIVFAKKAIRLDPFPRISYLMTLGRAYFMTAQYDESVSTFKKALHINPNSLSIHAFLAACYSSLDRPAAAAAEVKEVLRINPKFSLESYAKTLPYKNKADIERYLAALHKAGLPETPPLPLPDKPSIAVLPFTNMSGDPEQEYFSDGIAEEIITALSKTPKLFVIARNSTFTYKGKPVKVQQVGRELGVKYVLEGSVRKARDKVRITAQLVDAQTGHHLWAERYDRDMKDIFAIQDEITMKIITALQVKLTEGEQARLSAKRTDNIDAFLKYVEGREHLFRFNKDSNILARQNAEEALALDPEYSNAYSLLGKTHILDVWFKWSKSPKESLTHAFELAKKALALDESDDLAHRILSHIYLLKRQHDKAIAECERAVLLSPNAADAVYNLGLILRFSGRAKEAIPMHERAIRLNPIPPANYLYQLGLCYTFIGEFEKAITICKKALCQNPNDLVGRVTLAIAYSSLGREGEARAEAAELLRIHPKFSLEYAAKTWPYKNQADRDFVLNALRKAGLK
jgi:adenylate cyclase